MRVLALALLAAGGCQQACPDVSRYDGLYAVYMDTEGVWSQVTGTNKDDYPIDEVFIEGWTEWTLAYIPVQQVFKLDLSGQPYTADYTPDAADCDRFTLRFDGTWTAEGGTLHDFAWTGDLSGYGSHLGGTFSYEDSWRDPAGGTGSLSVPEAEFTGNVAE